MSTREPSKAVARLVAAINDGDRDAFLATLRPELYAAVIIGTSPASPVG